MWSWILSLVSKPFNIIIYRYIDVHVYGIQWCRHEGTQTVLRKIYQTWVLNSCVKLSSISQELICFLFLFWLTSPHNKFRKNLSHTAIHRHPHDICISLNIDKSIFHALFPLHTKMIWKKNRFLKTRIACEINDKPPCRMNKLRIIWLIWSALR